MAISRPLLLALIAALVALVGFYATSGARQSTEGSAAPVKPAPEPSPGIAKGGSARGAAKARKTGKPPSGAPTRARQADRPRRPTRPGIPGAVKRALAGRRTVVLFFYQRGAADDRATGRAVSALRRGSRAQVFSAPISRLGDYQAVVGGTGISQAPAVVIIGRDRQARLIEGFVDRKSLAQHVADAR